MNNTLDSRPRIRMILIVMILATLPCYCVGLVVNQVAGRPVVYPTSTPLWMLPETPGAYPTATETPLWLLPTMILPPTATPYPTQGFTPSPTTTLAPTFTPPPTPTETIQPTDILFPTPTDPSTMVVFPTDSIPSVTPTP